MISRNCDSSRSWVWSVESADRATHTPSRTGSDAIRDAEVAVGALVVGLLALAVMGAGCARMPAAAPP
jgi:hypothetical protein